MTPSWCSKPLDQLSRPQWEALCDGCGRCCLVKFIDEDTDRVHFTDVACRLLDRKSCRCSNYAERTRLVTDCIRITPENLPDTLPSLPPTCAYRLRSEGRALEWWHPLVSGDPNTVHTAGISVRGRCVSEVGLSDDEIAERLVRWPQTRKARRR